MNRSFSMDKSSLFNCLENLSNEIFYEIFDYLDGNDMIKAFSNLNHRFQILIHHPSIRLKLTYNRGKSVPMNEFYREIIEPNRNRLVSLQINSELRTRPSYEGFLFDASFSRVEFLRLDYSSILSVLIRDSHYLNSLPRLYSLYFSFNEINPYAMADILCLITSLPVLKRCIIRNDLAALGFAILIILPASINSTSSSIEYLRFEGMASAQTFVFLLEHMPNIRHLDCELSDESDRIVRDSETIHLPHLKQLTIRNDGADFDEVEILTKSIGHHVEILKLKQIFHESYFDARRWERLIETYLPRLKVFEIGCVNICHTLTESIYDFLGPFSSPFWTERRWFPSVTFSLTDMQFSIHPYKKQWFDRHQEIETDWIISQSPSYQNLFNHLYENSACFNKLELCGPFSKNEYTSTWIENIKDYLSKVTFKQLSVTEQRRLSSLFQVLGDSMIHLDVFTLDAIPDADLQSVCETTTKCKLELENRNRITKVNVGRIRKLEEIQLVMDLFPRMEFLELGIKSDALDAITVLDFILRNRSMKVPNLRSICFNGTKIDRDVLDQLRQLINAKPFLRNHHLRCIKNQIYIQWN